MRDIIQNHLLQAFMFAAMEPPEDMSAAAIGRAKVELLQCVRAPEAARGEVFLGQFSAGRGKRGYLDDDTVPEPEPEPEPEPLPGTRRLALPHLRRVRALRRQRAVARRALPAERGQGPR